MWKVPREWEDIIEERWLEKPWNAVGSKEYYPSSERVLRAFECTAPNKIRAVLVGMDPYVQPGVAMGLSFSVPPGLPCNPSLRNVFKALQAQFPGRNPPSLDLTRWATDEGVLLLNAALTVRPEKSGSHLEHWHEFTQNVLGAIKRLDQPIVWFLWGRDAEGVFGANTNEKHLVLRAPHPSPRNLTRFVDHEAKQKSFIRANEFLVDHGVKPVEWLE